MSRRPTMSHWHLWQSTVMPTLAHPNCCFSSCSVENTAPVLVKGHYIPICSLSQGLRRFKETDTHTGVHTYEPSERWRRASSFHACLSVNPLRFVRGPPLASAAASDSVEWLTLVTALLQSRHDLNSLFELPLTPNCEETGGWLRHRGIYFIPSACRAVQTSLRGEQTAPVSRCDLCSHVRAGELSTSLSWASQALSIINHHQPHIITHNRITNRTQNQINFLVVSTYFCWNGFYDWTFWLMWCSWWLALKFSDFLINSCRFF